MSKSDALLHAGATKNGSAIRSFCRQVMKRMDDGLSRLG
ncbi:hypothetical protein NBRC3257_1419 [Gluconobacter thailandicus NBRC 3257]|uniref:Transposase n=1 Tax=Gluconobacter thailandicus NBRC 3257 TaxID=1381097 RepID=A0ABQ0IW26_GLUTH|nr:hypothetical protein B932_1022 [Gluconobacter oxydans H24]GAC87842.1 hypothetical protein NBRC3255_1502 [Gluconobacter thailandicus NBRC 3255]GAD26421.1 hypothetical protein NBRC3257_1419 [Gluconobacter thailandicus NBRC 3257]